MAGQLLRLEPALTNFAPVDDEWPNPDGCLRLVHAFWRAVHHDLAAGSEKARAWLESDDFVGWASLCAPKHTPGEVATLLMETYWRVGVEGGKVFGRLMRSDDADG